MEYNLYNKINCSIFDLMGKDNGVKHNEHEPNQTKGLGYLLAKSAIAMKAFCSLVGETIVKGDRWTVDCEMMSKTSPKVLQRIDILIRITNKKGLTRSLLIEAKSFNSKTPATNAINQASHYASAFGVTIDKIVSLTFDYDYSIVPLVKTSIPIVMIRWRDVLNALLKTQSQEPLLIDYINYLIKNNHVMNYYDDEVLTIPARGTYDAVNKSSLYVCPSSFSFIKKKPLYVAFRGYKGKTTELYKVEEKFILDPYDSLSITKITKQYLDFSKRMDDYLSMIKHTKLKPTHSPHCVFYLDKNSMIKLPTPVYITTSKLTGRGSGVQKHAALPLKAMFVTSLQTFNKIVVHP